MAKFVPGTTMKIGFADNNGTFFFDAQYTKYDTSWIGDKVDVSSGAATAHQYLPTLKDFTATYVGMNDGKGSPFGTADLIRLEPTLGGTLLWAPLGTASGNPKWGVFTYVTKQDTTYPFAGAVETTIDFQGSDALIYDGNSAVW